jgi:hypothetical protein
MVANASSLSSSFQMKALRAYAYMPTDGIWENPERAGEIAAELLEEGNTAMKFDPFPPLFPQPRDIPL